MAIYVYILPLVGGLDTEEDLYPSSVHKGCVDANS